MTFRLADGGAVTFGLMRRTDTIGVKPTAKELVLPAEYAKVTGKKKVTKSLTLQNLEPFVMVDPADRRGRGHRREPSCSCPARAAERAAPHRLTESAP